jgi:hypothetical protein
MAMQLMDMPVSRRSSVIDTPGSSGQLLLPSVESGDPALHDPITVQRAEAVPMNELPDQGGA